MDGKYYPPHIHKCSLCGKDVIVPSYPISNDNINCCMNAIQNKKAFVCSKCISTK